jgi:hypothetical protein
MILFLPEPLICAPPISASAVVGRNARLGLLWCVGHAHTTEAIPECIRGGGTREAESNMRLLGIVANEIRVSHQPQDGQSARPHHTADCARPRRRGDRMSAKVRRREFISLLGGSRPGAWARKTLAESSLSGKARRNTGIGGRKPGSTSGSRHGVGDLFTALRRQGLTADELVLQLTTFLRSLDLFLELIVPGSANFHSQPGSAWRQARHR